MKRSSALISIGITAALIAAGIWFLFHWGFGPWSNNGGWWSMHQGWYGPDTMMGYGGGMGIMGLLFWGLVIVVIISLIARARSPVDSTTSRPYDPLEILKQRYARGEIDKDQFKALRHDLGV
jgi:putative membrane protein